MKPPKEEQGAEPLPPLQLPEGPHIVRDAREVATHCTEAGLQLIRVASAEGCAQVHIASLLGISLKTFERLLGKASDDPMRPERAAYEEGQGALKSEMIRLCIAGARRGGLVQPLFLLKSIFGLRDQGPAVAIDTGNKINFTLPGPAATVEDFMRSIGQEKIIDSRDTRLIRETMGAQGKSEAEIADYLRSIGRHDDAGPPPQLLPKPTGENQNANQA
jgi:hypothetical protein